MQNTQELKSEYLELLKILNSTNRTKNQATELVFLVKEVDGRKYLLATVNHEKFLNFGEIDFGFYLKTDPYLKYQKFAGYIQIPISKTKTVSELNLTIRLLISNLFTAQEPD
jgi:hypothetical protein